LPPPPCYVSPRVVSLLPFFEPATVAHAGRVTQVDGCVRQILCGVRASAAVHPSGFDPGSTCLNPKPPKPMSHLHSVRGLRPFSHSAPFSRRFAAACLWLAVPVGLV